MKKHQTKWIKYLGLLSVPVVAGILAACVNASTNQFKLETYNSVVIQENNNEYYVLLETTKTTELSKEAIRDLSVDVMLKSTNLIESKLLNQSVLYDQANRYIKIKLPQRPFENDLVNISFNNKQFQPLSFALKQKNINQLQPQKIDFSFSSDQQKLTVDNTKVKLGFDTKEQNMYDYTIEIHLNELNDDGSIKNTNPIKSSKSKLSSKEVEFVNLNPNAKYKIINVAFFVDQGNDKYHLINDYVVNVDKAQTISFNPLKINEYNIEFIDTNKNLVYRDQKFELKYNVNTLKDKFITVVLQEWDKTKNDYVDKNKTYESLRNDVIDNKTKFSNLKYNTVYKITKVNFYDQPGYVNTSYDTVINLPKEDVFITTPKQDITFNISENNLAFVLKDKKLEINYELNFNSKYIEIELTEVDDQNQVIDDSVKLKSEITDITTKKAIFDNLKGNSKYKITNVYIYDSKTDKNPNESFNVLIPNIQNILTTPEIPTETPKENTETANSSGDSNTTTKPSETENTSQPDAQPTEGNSTNDTTSNPTGSEATTNPSETENTSQPVEQPSEVDSTNDTANANQDNTSATNTNNPSQDTETATTENTTTTTASS